MVGYTNICTNQIQKIWLLQSRVRNIFIQVKISKGNYRPCLWSFWLLPSPCETEMHWASAACNKPVFLKSLPLQTSLEPIRFDTYRCPVVRQLSHPSLLLFSVSLLILLGLVFARLTAGLPVVPVCAEFHLQNEGTVCSSFVLTDLIYRRWNRLIISSNKENQAVFILATC